MTGVLGGGHQVFKWLVITRSFLYLHTSQGCHVTSVNNGNRV